MEKLVPQIKYSKCQWKIIQKGYNPSYSKKTESIMAQGNGQIGLRAADEISESTRYQRNMFVAGSYNKPNRSEVPELPNLADITHMDLEFDNELVTSASYRNENYNKQLHLKNGELKRSVLLKWKKSVIKVVNRRFVSLNDSSLICFRTIIKVKKGNLHKVNIKFGIDGQQTNSGVQHFEEGIGKYYKEHSIIEYTQEATQSGLVFCYQIGFNAYLNDVEIFTKAAGSGGRRQVWGYVWVENFKEGDVLVIERIANITTNANYQNRLMVLETLKAQCLWELIKYKKLGYKKLLQKSALEWKRIWKHWDIKVGSNGIDQLAYRFAVYHLVSMTPTNSTYATTGAKGLTGEKYKGHAFWDNEIFILPVYSYMNPQIARNMMYYRFRNLLGARKKAKEYGYLGAMYPWEAAYPYDSEACPKYGNIDGESGETSVVWPGIIEQHPVADIAYGLSWYCQVTSDTEFFKKYGFEMAFEIARFWTSRVEYNETKDHYEIKNVIGPNEYKEHVNNNAFTNYMAKWSIELVFIHSQTLLGKDYENEYQKMIKKLGITKKEITMMKNVMEKMYLPQPNSKNIIPENDTYLALPDIENLSVFKNPNRWITKEIPWSIVKNSQVTKQADVVCLLWLLRWNFNSQLIIDNINYYNLRTVHESSLSYNTHALLAIQERMEKAMYFYKKAIAIDLGPNMTSSDEGIHAASLGGIWQMFYFGFAGISAHHELNISPRLPQSWKHLHVKFFYKGNLIRLYINHKEVHIKVSRGFQKIQRNIPYDCPVNVITYHKTPTPIYVTFNQQAPIKIEKEHIFIMDPKINFLDEPHAKEEKHEKNK